MRRPPRAPEEPLLSGKVNALERFARNIRPRPCGIDLHDGLPPRYARNQESSTRFLLARNRDLALIFVNRSFSASVFTAVSRPNRALKFVFVGVAGTLAIALTWPGPRSFPSSAPCTQTILRSRYGWYCCALRLGVFENHLACRTARLSSTCVPRSASRDSSIVYRGEKTGLTVSL
jgi:hypothetical protein